MEERLYRRINNPLDNDRIMKDVLYEYIYSDSLFNGLFRNKSRNNSQSMIFHDVLFKRIYDDWKRKIDGLYEIINEDDSNYDDIKSIYNFLNNYHVKNYKDVSIVLDAGYKYLGELFKKYCPINCDDEGFTTINSSKRKSFDHGLCINCDLSKIHFILYKFYEKCLEYNLDFCFKFDESGLRKDSITIYSDYDNFSIYLKILEDIINENDICSYLDSLALCIGEISNKIGYVSGKEDFSKRRVCHIEDCIEQETIKWINKFYGDNIKTSTGRVVPYKSFLFGKVIMEKKHQLMALLKPKEVNSKDLTKLLNDFLNRNINNIFKAVVNREYGYSLMVRYKNRIIEFTYNDFLNLLKEQVSFFMNYDGFENSIKNRIRNTSTKYGIDTTNYGMDIGDAYLLGKEVSVPMKRVTIDILNNFDDSKRMVKGSREGYILDGNIKKKFFNNVLLRVKNRSKAR